MRVQDIDIKALKKMKSIALAIIHPKRRRLLMVIEKEGPICVTDLTFIMNETQSQTSAYLTTLKKAGLITSSINGTHRMYEVAPQGIAQYLAHQEIINSSFENS